MGDILVVCPKCGGCARDAAREGGHRRLSCTGCAHVADLLPEGKYKSMRSHFGLPLWLSAPCCGEVLWAYNREHLDFIEAYVGATLREPVRNPEWGWRNQSLASRLPRWMKLATHREEILRTVHELRAKL
jgi:hypothetical protein